MSRQWGEDDGRRGDLEETLKQGACSDQKNGDYWSNIREVSGKPEEEISLTSGTAKAKGTGPQQDQIR